MRRRTATKRVQTPDVKYNSELVGRLINTIMTRGKKSTAQSIVYGALDLIKTKKPEMDALEEFLQALENVKPKLEVKSRRVGGATYQVPVEVSHERQVALAMRWITSYSRGRKGKSITESLASELLEDENVYQSMAKAVNPYGDGTACARIAEAIKWHFGFRADRPEDFNV